MSVRSTALPVSSQSTLSMANGKLVNTAVPPVAWTKPPTFVTTGQFLGGGCLAGGTGTLAFSIPPNGNGSPTDQATITGGVMLRVPASASAFSATSDFLQFKDSSGNVFGFRVVNGKITMNFDGLTDTGLVVGDGNWHQVGWEMPSNYGGQQYNQVYLDGANAVQVKFSDRTYLHAGIATLLVDFDQLPTGSLMQCIYSNTLDTHPVVPTALYTAKMPNQVLTMNLVSDAANIAVDPVPTVIGPAGVDGVSIAQDQTSGLLYSPFVIASYPLLKMPIDGSFFDQQINAFLADASLHKKSRAVLSEGRAMVGSPINVPSNVSFEGTGKPNPWPDGWGGGTSLVCPQDYRQAIVQAIGVNKGQDSSGMLQCVRIKDLAIFPLIAGGTATKSFSDGSQTQQAALDIQNVCYAYFESLWIGRDYARAVRLSNLWDSDGHDFTITNSSGWCDPTQTTDSAAWQQVTGRSFMATETKLGYSLGVPAFEIISPDTSGGDVTNNIRLWSGRQESNASNGVPLLIRGSNSGMIQISGWKIEANEGMVPVLVVEGAHNFSYEGWLMGAANGSPFVQTGGVAAGTAWSTYQQPAIALFKDCYSPRLKGGISHQSNGGKTDALLRFIDTSNPIVDMTAEDGLDHCTVARMIFDDCRNVSRSHTRLYADAYVPGVGSLPERVYQTTSQSTQEEA